MNGRERGFLLLSSHLGDPDRRPLSVAQLRTLAERMRQFPVEQIDRELEQQDFLRLGYGREMASRMLHLLSEEERLDWFVQKAQRCGCVPVTRVTARYPALLRKRLGPDSPGVLWAKGNLELLEQPMVALVGSRDLLPENARFAAQVGKQAALQGYVLVSGNARGADRVAQQACLAAGGNVISIVADELCKQPNRTNTLYLSEDGFEDPFSSQRALSRNRCIHAMGILTFVAQTGLKKGGTWDGTVKNLRHGWSSVYGFADGSEGMRLLEDQGAVLLTIPELCSFYDLDTPNLFDL